MRSNTPLLGIVGPPGCGKSTLAAAMSEGGAIIIDADGIGHEMLEDSSVRDNLVAEFGSEMIVSGDMDRSILSKIVTQDRMSMDRFNRIVHPPLLERIADRIHGIYRTFPGGVPVVDAALIPEWGIVSFFDLLIYIHCPIHIRMRRLTSAGKDTAAIERLASYQSPDHVKRSACHVVVDNIGTRDELVQRGSALIRCICATRTREEGEGRCQKRLWTA